MQITESYYAEKTNAAIVCTTCLNTLELSQVRFCMPEFQPLNKKTTSKDRSLIYCKPIQILKSFPILVQGSTLKEKAYYPYWNDRCRENASHLLSLIGTDLLASASISLSGLLPDRKGRSWCLTKSIPLLPRNLQETLWRSSQYSPPDYTDSGTTVIRSKKIQLRPNKEQIKILKNWAGAYRWAYNQTIDYCMEGSYSYLAMRKEWKARMVDVAPWIADIAAHTIYGAMMDAAKDYKNHVKKLKDKLASSIPRCKKHKQRSFYILGNAISKSGIYTRLLGKMRSYERLPDKPKDSRIIFEFGKWYLQAPYEITRRITENQGFCVSLDPGVRSFLTYFSPFEIGKIGQGQFSRIVKLAKFADDLQSRMTKNYKLKKAYRRSLKRIRNLVDDLHYQSISFLMERFDTFICPVSNFTSAVSVINRKIKSKTVRSLLTFAFARFRDRLADKCALLGKRFIEVCESYTSKTHNFTGEVINNLGGRKYIVSNGIRVERDINGAFGIFLKGLLAQPALEKELHLLSKINEK